MINELIFTFYCFLGSISAIGAIFLGKEALIALISLEIVIVNFFVAKEIILLGFAASAADALAVGITLAFNVLQEYYGKQEAKRALSISIFACIFFTFISLLHCTYVPSAGDLYNVHYCALLLPLPRIIGMSLLVYYCVQTIDIRLYAFLKKILPSYQTTRTVISLVITQLLDTTLFTLFALYGIVENIGSVIVVSYFIKLLAIAMIAPFIAFTKRFIHTYVNI